MSRVKSLLFNTLKEMKRNMLSHRREYITKRKNELLKERKSLLKTTIRPIGRVGQAGSVSFEGHVGTASVAAGSDTLRQEKEALTPDTR